MAARDALADFFLGARDEPGDWPGVAVLAAARPYPARHASILLPFEAVAAAAEAAARPVASAAE
jgi:NifU-like protein involved in Fe-S cluster formation